MWVRVPSGSCRRCFVALLQIQRGGCCGLSCRSTGLSPTRTPTTFLAAPPAAAVAWETPSGASSPVRPLDGLKFPQPQPPPCQRGACPARRHRGPSQAPPSLPPPPSFPRGSRGSGAAPPGARLWREAAGAGIACGHRRFVAGECPREPKGGGWRAVFLRRRSRGGAGGGLAGTGGPPPSPGQGRTVGPPEPLWSKHKGTRACRPAAASTAPRRLSGWDMATALSVPLSLRAGEGSEGFPPLRCGWHTCSFLNGRSTPNAPTALLMKILSKYRVRRN